MRKYLFIAFCTLAFCSLPGRADTVAFSVLPGSMISGGAGSTIGFGYSIDNETDSYYQATSLSAGSFASGTPTNIFDFPLIEPDSSVVVPFSEVSTVNCGAPPCGLYTFLMNGLSPSTDTGLFLLSGEFFGDSNETVDLGAAPDLSAGYSVQLAGGAEVPEPLSIGFLVFGLLTCLLQRKRAWKS